MGRSKHLMPLEDIKERVLSAVVDLFKYDSDLLDRETNERSITHKLAEHLQRKFPEWNVDCEYNRWFDKTKKIIYPTKEIVEKLTKEIIESTTKKTEKEKSEEVAAKIAADTKARTVFPDIIVHKRGRQENLIVIEVKKRSNTSNRDGDFEKLKTFTKEGSFRYLVGLSLEVGKANETVKLAAYCNGNERGDLTKDWETILNGKLEVLGYGG